MPEKIVYRQLSPEDIRLLQDQGCSALDWDRVQVEEGFRPIRLRNTHFAGTVKIGRHTAAPPANSVPEKISGIFNAYLADCTLGRDVRIANVGVHIANYDIADNVVIEDIGIMESTPGASFGNGVEIEVLNEAGGREVILFDELSAQFAYLLCLHRYRPELIEQLGVIIKNYISESVHKRGHIGAGSQICSTREIINVRIGENARIRGASSLSNGTILSSPDAPSLIASGVIARDFIIAENASVTDAAVLQKVYVGQGSRIGKQFSAENSLFFANCEAFHGEACSIFAGPYTVTHHKSSLLIAGLFSFYNAGSGTNQSNHMYKLGPVHEGRLDRGSKTGSFSYMMWPCHVGPFSVVLGKHKTNFDASLFPFSHLEASQNGRCYMVPGLYLNTVGTVRDEAKWPTRDKRPAAHQRDYISFHTLSPYTMGKIIAASAALNQLRDTTDPDRLEIALSGALIKRPFIRAGLKFYRSALQMYILEKIFDRARKNEQVSLENIRRSFSVNNNAVYSEQWVDIAGLLMPIDRLRDLQDDIAQGRLADIHAFNHRLQQIHDAYLDDEWAWVAHNYEQVFNADLMNLTKDDLVQIARDYLKARQKHLNQVIADAQKEFDQQSRLGFGLDGSPGDILNDFEQVRGSFEKNQFVVQVKKILYDLEKQVEIFINKLNSC